MMHWAQLPASFSYAFIDVTFTALQIQSSRQLQEIVTGWFI